MCYSRSFDVAQGPFVAGLPAQLAPLEAWLGQRPSSACWIAAKRITAADFFVYDLLSALQMLAPRLRDAVPQCYAHHDRVHELPSLALYRGSARFNAVCSLNNKSASFK
jgi:glutathione S-transferase